MAGQHAAHLSAFDAPEPYRPIVSAGGQRFAVGRERGMVDIALVPEERTSARVAEPPDVVPFKSPCVFGVWPRTIFREQVYGFVDFVVMVKSYA